MKVLHFIDKNVRTAGNDVFDYLPALLRGLSVSVDTAVVAPAASAHSYDSGRLRVFHYRTAAFFAVSDMLLFGRVLKSEQPDIVHIHGCSSVLSCLFMRKCLSRNIPVVITTGKQFEPWNLCQSYLLSRLPRLLAFQRGMLRQACAIHALCRQEQDNLLRLGWLPSLKAKSPLNANITVIPNFNIAPRVTAGDMASAMKAFYQKVADSNPFMLMSDADRACEDILLAAGVAPDPSGVPPLADADRELLAALDEESTRRLLLHAADEGIYRYVVESALRLKVRIPAVNVSAVERFKSHYRRSGGGASAGEEADYSRFDSDETLTDAERDVCRVFVSTWRKYCRRELRRCDLAALYKTLRFTDYDEVMLRHALRRAGFLRRSARLMALLAERYTLTEGFMFTPPLADKGTSRIRRRLYWSGVQ